MRHTKFLTGSGPMFGKSIGMGTILSNLASTPAFCNPFQHFLANLMGCILALLVFVHSKPPFLTSGAASATNSSMSFLTLHRFFLIPTLELGGSRMTMSKVSPRLLNRANQSKPIRQKNTKSRSKLSGAHYLSQISLYKRTVSVDSVVLLRVDLVHLQLRADTIQPFLVQI